MPEENNNTQGAPEPLTAESVAEIVNTHINKFVASNKTDIAKMREKVTSLEGTLSSFQSAPAPTTTTSTEQTAADPKLSVLERKVKELEASNTAALEKAAKADRDSALNRVLSGYNFASDKARDIAYKTFSSDMKSIGDGEYAIGDQPLAEAVKSTMADLTGLLAAKNVGGSGASSGKAPALDTSQVRRGMSKDEMQALANEILKTL
jgi:hypothetical protein